MSSVSLTLFKALLNVNRSSLLNTCITRSQTPSTPLHTQSHTQHATLLIPLIHTVHTPSYVLYCSFLQYSGRLVHKGHWGDALPTGKGVVFFCRILPLDRLICLCMSLSNQPTVTQATDRQTWRLKWPCLFFGQNGNRPRSLSLTLLLNPFLTFSATTPFVLWKSAY